MHLASEKVEIKLISENDLISNKKNIISLLEDNLKINFPYINNLVEYAVNGYEDMVRFGKDNSAILIGAFEEEMILGFLWAYKREFLGEVRIHLNHIIVNSTARSVGIGSRLLNALEFIAQERDILKIELMTTVENERTIEFYKSNGFSSVRVQLEKELGELNDNR